jgi:hypothetical protein
MRRVGRIVLASMVGIASLGAYSDDVARGDSAWASRAEGHQEGRPQSDPILSAVRFYESALAAIPQSLEARWKLLRALHFAGDFALKDAPERSEIFDRARRVSEEGLDRLADRVSAGLRLEANEPETIRAELEATDVSSSDVARLGSFCSSSVASRRSWPSIRPCRWFPSMLRLERCGNKCARRA